MPVAYRIDQSAAIILETWEGPVTAAELREYWQTLLSDPAVLSCRRILTDMSEARVQLTWHDLQRGFRELIVPRLGPRRWYLAVAARSDVAYGTARQFEMLSEANVETRVFHDYEEARAWLLTTPAGA